jgi:hypothetical protein
MSLVIEKLLVFFPRLARLSVERRKQIDSESRGASLICPRCRLERSRGPVGSTVCPQCGRNFFLPLSKCL